MEKIITPEFRGSFVSILEPQSMPGASEGSKPKYQITIPLGKSDPFWKKLEAQIEQAAMEKWGKIPPRLKKPIKDGDELQREEFADKFTVQATTLNRPGIVDKALQPIMDPDEIYSGAYYRVSVRCFAWEHPTGGKGVSVALDNVMKIKDGPAFSGKTDAASDFSEFAASESGLLD